MCKYELLLAKWQSLIEMAKRFDADASMKIGEKASHCEIINIETELSAGLPPSFRDVILSVGKSFELYYSFYDYVLPDEFRNILFGCLSWDVSDVHSMKEFMGDKIEDGSEVDAYPEKMENLFSFSYSGNGDVYAFDMSATTPEKPVVYWEHETGDIHYVADSFGEYLEKITDLYCIGDTIWQYEAFLGKRGLDTSAENAQRWKKWFESFTSTELADVTGDFGKLYEFAVCRKNLDENTKAALQSYGKEPLFEALKETLKDGLQRQEAACEMMVIFIGDYAQDWLISFWNNATVSKTNYAANLTFDGTSILPKLLSYLSANCLDKTIGSKYVMRYLDDNMDNGTDLDILAYILLQYFDAGQVIPWMEKRLTQRPDWWGRLFIAVKPKWETFLKWSKGEKKCQATLLEGLYCFVTGSAYEIAGIPPREELSRFLIDLKENQVLSTKKRKIDEVIANIDYFYNAGIREHYSPRL